jgi:NitT/TauT family transport system permease protein
MTAISGSDTSPVIHSETRVLPKRQSRDIMQWLLPAASLLIGLAIWELYWQFSDPRPNVVWPPPSAIFGAMIEDRWLLLTALQLTLTNTLIGFFTALIGAVILAVIFDRFIRLEQAFFPYAVFMQVTPVVTIAPLLVIVLDERVALVACIFLVAFFPILTNTLQGLKSVDHGLISLFELYRATSWQKLVLLKARAAMPHFVTGIKIGGGLALIGAIVGEFVVSSPRDGYGIAFRLFESAYRNKFPRLYACILVIQLAGIAIFFLMNFVSNRLLGNWHESAIKRDV